jgi:rare lipoprotein A
MRILLISVFLFFTVQVIAQDSVHIEFGKATYYHKRFEGRKTSNGEKFTHKKLTAAHKTIPFNTWIRVTNLDNDKNVVVRVNDRMPKTTRKACLDLTYTAALALDMVYKGRVDVKIEILDSLMKDSASAPVPLVASKNNSKKNHKEIKSDSVKTIFAGDSHLTALLDTSLNEIEREGYGIQVLSYNSKQKAQEAALKLTKKYNESATIQKIKLNEKIFYRVIIGESSQRDELTALKQKLKSDYKDCYALKF